MKQEKDLRRGKWKREIVECVECGDQYTREQVIEEMGEEFLERPFICKDCWERNYSFLVIYD